MAICRGSSIVCVPQKSSEVMSNGLNLTPENAINPYSLATLYPCWMYADNYVPVHLQLLRACITVNSIYRTYILCLINYGHTSCPEG